MNFTFFSSAHGTFSRIDHILGHKSSLRKFKKIEIILSIFSDHNAVRLDLNYRRKSIKNSNIWRLKNMLLNNQQITKEIKKDIKICIETNENENTTTQKTVGHCKSSTKGKVFLYFFALIAEEGFLISSCYSLELCIQMIISFLFSFTFHFSSFHSYL